MLEPGNIDLTKDPLAARYVKSEIVTVRFARQAGELISLEGPNRYRSGDALITGSTGGRWSVARQRFDAKYEALPPTLARAGWAVRRPAPAGAGKADRPTLHCRAIKRR